MAYDSDRILGTVGTNLNATVSSRLGAINAVYRGTISVGGGDTSGTATISAVTLARSVLTPLGTTGGAGGLTRLELTNTTTITVYLTAAYDISAAGYQVVEYAS